MTGCRLTVDWPSLDGQLPQLALLRAPRPTTTRSSPASAGPRCQERALTACLTSAASHIDELASAVRTSTLEMRPPPVVRRGWSVKPPSKSPVRGNEGRYLYHAPQRPFECPVRDRSNGAVGRSTHRRPSGQATRWLKTTPARARIPPSHLGGAAASLARAWQPHLRNGPADASNSGSGGRFPAAPSTAPPDIVKPMSVKPMRCCATSDDKLRTTGIPRGRRTPSHLRFPCVGEGT